LKKTKVLFVCIHNSARSQMAEAFANSQAGSKCEAFSAGLEAGTLNPDVVEVMKEEGIDISKKRSKSVQEFLDKKEIFDYVVTVCDKASAEKCPVFPGPGKRLHWAFPDPSSLDLPKPMRLARIREIRDEIKARVASWVRGL